MKRLFISSRISCYKTVMAAVFVASFVILLVANYGVGLPFNTTQQNYQTSQGPEPKGAGYFYSAKRILLPTNWQMKSGYPAPAKQSHRVVLRIKILLRKTLLKQWKESANGLPVRTSSA